MGHYKKFLLGSRGNQYISEALTNGKTLSQFVFASLDLNDGISYTYLPSNVSEEDALKFSSGGKIPISSTTSYVVEDGIKLRYERFDSLVDTIIPIIQVFLKLDKDHICVFEDALAGPDDNFIKKSCRCILVFDNEVYHYIPRDDFQDAALMTKVIHLAGSILGFMTKQSSGDELHKRVKVDEKFLNQLAMNVEVLIIEAYDGEGYLIWETRKRISRHPP